MGSEVKESFDLAYFDRFDAATVEMQAKLSTAGVSFSESLEGSGFALFLNKRGDTLAIKAVETDGLPLVAHGRGSKKTWLLCPALIRAVELRGGAIPQAMALVYDQKTEAYIGKLKTAKERSNP